MVYALKRKYILAACDDGGVRIYDEALQELTTLRGHCGPVLSVQAFDEFLITAGDDGKLIMWDYKGIA